MDTPFGIFILKGYFGRKNAMILKNITIQNLGSIDYLSQEFSDRINIINTRQTDEMFYAIKLSLNHKTPPQEEIKTDKSTRIDATVNLGGEDFDITIAPDESGMLRLVCYGSGGLTDTNQYLYLSSHCEEQDNADTYDGENPDSVPKFLQYLSEDYYFPDRELSEKTDGLSDIKSFRRQLRLFVNEFEPRLIREGKQYEIRMDKNGRYTVRSRISPSETVHLSESENLLFSYLCFLYNAKFWDDFNEMRDLNRVKKPLIVKSLLERIDEGIDITEILDQTKKTERQVIILKR